MDREIATDTAILERLAAPAGKDLLDVGCGSGVLVRELSAGGARATGLEISDQALASAREQDPDGIGRYLVGRAESLPVGVAGLVSLVFAGSAMAWTRPSPSTRTAITNAAKRSLHAGTGRIHVSDIRVSTVGPWASVALTIYVAHQPDRALAVLHKIRGRWVETAHSPGTSRVQCRSGMSHRDQRNLGLPVC